MLRWYDYAVTVSPLRKRSELPTKIFFHEKKERKRVQMP